eukprot:m.44574 g.44574  ORF g.44574 m.44574 type:complete len:329 (-) comp8556_c0_seq1:2033-3019(-)
MDPEEQEDEMEGQAHVHQDQYPPMQPYGSAFGGGMWKPQGGMQGGMPGGMQGGMQPGMMVSLHGQMPHHDMYQHQAYWQSRAPMSMQWVPHSESDGASGIDKLANVAVGQTAPSAVPPPDAGYPFVVDPSQLGQMGMHHQWGAPHGDDSYVYNPYPQQHTPQSDASDSTRPRRPSVRMIAGAQALQGLAQALAESSHPEQSTPTGHQYSESKPQKSRANSRLTPTEEQTSPVESGAAAESRTAKAKETHRQAEQRRRQQQIDAATELKKILRMHEGTPLGVTLTYASEHIHELRKTEAYILKEIERQRAIRDQLRSRHESVAQHHNGM